MMPVCNFYLDCSRLPPEFKVFRLHRPPSEKWKDPKLVSVDALRPGDIAIAICTAGSGVDEEIRVLQFWRIESNEDEILRFDCRTIAGHAGDSQFIYDNVVALFEKQSK